LNFDITILGCGAATPTQRLAPTAQFVSIHEQSILLDCGEGTQIRLRELGIKMQKIQVICISHLHGDHIFGLVGLLSTYSLLGRTKELTIIGPPELEEWILHTLKISASYLTFQLTFIATSTKEEALVWENEHVQIYAVPLKHRIACCGFLLRETEHLRKIYKSAIEEYGLGIEEMIQLKRGMEIERTNGLVITPEMVCEPPVRSRSYFFCTDTLPLQKTFELLFDVDLLYHESTFLEEHNERAKATFHSTAKQAAVVAKHLRSKKLLLGHFSARYPDYQIFVEEAKAIFTSVELAEEGKTWKIELA
jgi:ribonuclease Z